MKINIAMGDAVIEVVHVHGVVVRVCAVEGVGRKTDAMVKSEDRQDTDVP